MSDWTMEIVDDDPRSEVSEPTRTGPPEDQLAGVVPVEVVMGRTDDVAVVLTGVRAFPSGVGMVLGVRLRRRVPEVGMDVWEDVFDHRRSDGAEDPRWQEARLRWGFTFADGVVVGNLDRSTAGVTLHGGGGSGSDLSCDRDYWLSCLPPAAPVEVFCAWPRVGLPLTRSSFDGRLVVDAALRSRAVWPAP